MVASAKFGRDGMSIARFRPNPSSAARLPGRYVQIWLVFWPILARQPNLRDFGRTRPDSALGDFGRMWSDFGAPRFARIGFRPARDPGELVRTEPDIGHAGKSFDQIWALWADRLSLSTAARRRPNAGEFGRSWPKLGKPGKKVGVQLLFQVRSDPAHVTCCACAARVPLT